MSAAIVEISTSKVLFIIVVDYKQSGDPHETVTAKKKPQWEKFDWANNKNASVRFVFAAAKKYRLSHKIWFNAPNVN